MAFEGDLTDLGLGDVLQNLRANELSGTLTLQGPAGTATIWVEGGRIAGCRLPEPEGVPELADLVHRERLLEPRALARALRRRGRRELRTWLCEQGLVSEQALRAAVERWVQEAVLELFTWEGGRFRFEEQQPGPAAMGGELWALRPAIEPAALLMEAARRSDEWPRIRRRVPSFKEVYIAEPVADPQAEQLDEVQYGVVSLLDGVRDLEAVSRTLPYGRFAIAEATAVLTESGRIKRVDAEQLRRRAAQLQAEGELQTAVRLLERSLELEPGAIQARAALARLLERLGRDLEAAEQYKQLGFYCREAGRLDEAIEAYRKAAGLVPADLGVGEALLGLLRASGREQQAIEAGRALAAAAAEQHLYDKAIAIYQELLPLVADKTALREQIAQTCLRKADREGALAAYREEARERLRADDLRGAAAAYRRILELDPQDEVAARELERVEGGWYERRRARRRRLRNAALLGLALALVGFQLAREVLAGLHLRALYPQALAPVAGELADPHARVQAYRAAERAWPWTLAGLFARQALRAALLQEARAAREVLARAGAPRLAAEWARARLQALAPLLPPEAVDLPPPPPAGESAGGAAPLPERARILGRIAQVLPDGAVRLDVGAAEGVRERMVFEAVSPLDAAVLLGSGELALVPERAIARLTVLELAPHSALAWPEAAAGDSAPAAAGERRRARRLEAGDLVISAPHLLPGALPPRITELSASPLPARFGMPVELVAECAGEPHEGLVFEWEASGGVLLHERTLTPHNVWLPPLSGRSTFTLQLTAIGAKGRQSRRGLQVQSEGFAGNDAGEYRLVRRVGLEPASFGRLLDLAFDDRGQALLLFGGRQRTLVRMDEQWQVVGRSEGQGLGLELTRILLAGDRLYAIDAEGRRAVQLGAERGLYGGAPAIVYGGPGSGNGRLRQPVDLAVDRRGRVYVLDGAPEQPAVHVFRNDGTFLLSLGYAGAGPWGLVRPVALDLGPDGTLFVLDDGRKAVLAYRGLEPSHEFAVGEEGERLVDLRVDPRSGRLYVLDAERGRIRVYDALGLVDGAPFGRAAAPPARAGQLPAMGSWERPARLRFDPRGWLYLVAGEGTALHRISTETRAELVRWAGLGLAEASRLAVGPEGGPAVLLPQRGQVYRLDRFGWVRAVVPGAGAAPLERPVDLAVDAAGRIYVLDAGPGAVLVYGPGGELLGRIGAGGSGPHELREPVALGLDPARRLLGVLERRAAWGVKLFDLQGRLLAALPGQQGALEGASDLALTPSGTVHVALGRRGAVRSFAAGEVVRSVPARWIEPAGENRLERGEWQAGGQRAERLAVSNLGLLFVLERGGPLQAVDLTRGHAPVARLAPSAELGEAADLAVDDYDQVYLLDPSAARLLVLRR
ncbi:MAG: hypothetical protein KatS3mg102_1149 [Planctomycetota bacterium]|nr:MAG: hypothetical protein KatS3mg102_1149 [Planctomycetota bacterium]